MRKIKLVHVITGLNSGGAEVMLYKLLSVMDKNLFDLHVISMLDEGVFGPKITALNIPVYCLNMKKYGLSSLGSLLKYRILIRKIKPDIVQGWMPHGNLYATLAKLSYFKAKIVFNIRQSLVNYKDKLSTHVIIKLNALFSRWVVAVVNNSNISQQQHAVIGFSKKNALYIANGFDVDVFKPDADLYKSVRKFYGLNQQVKIIGNLARFHPVKNHFGLLEILQKIHSECAQPIVFMLGGAGVDSENAELTKKVRELGLQKNCILLGAVESKSVMPAFDLYISSSWGEGFPNVIGEAMACGVPCVTTDVGDCKLIMGGFGGVAAAGDYDSLAKKSILYLDTSELAKKQIRQHIIDNYTIGKIAAQYESLYLDVLNK